LCIAGNDCLQEYRDYLSIEAAFLREIESIRASHNSPDQGAAAMGNHARESMGITINRYQHALMLFSNSLILHLELTSIGCNLDVKNWRVC
jgi:hypothetical protein